MDNPRDRVNRLRGGSQNRNSQRASLVNNNKSSNRSGNNQASRSSRGSSHRQPNTNFSHSGRVNQAFSLSQGQMSLSQHHNKRSKQTFNFSQNQGQMSLSQPRDNPLRHNNNNNNMKPNIKSAVISASNSLEEWSQKRWMDEQPNATAFTPSEDRLIDSTSSTSEPNLRTHLGMLYGPLGRLPHHLPVAEQNPSHVRQSKSANSILHNENDDGRVGNSDSDNNNTNKNNTNKQEQKEKDDKTTTLLEAMRDDMNTKIEKLTDLVQTHHDTISKFASQATNDQPKRAVVKRVMDVSTQTNMEHTRSVSASTHPTQTPTQLKLTSSRDGSTTALRAVDATEGVIAETESEEEDEDEDLFGGEGVTCHTSHVRQYVQDPKTVVGEKRESVVAERSESRARRKVTEVTRGSHDAHTMHEQHYLDLGVVRERPATSTRPEVVSTTRADYLAETQNYPDSEMTQSRNKKKRSDVKINHQTKQVNISQSQSRKNNRQVNQQVKAARQPSQLDNSDPQTSESSRSGRKTSQRGENKREMAKLGNSSHQASQEGKSEHQASNRKGGQSSKNKREAGKPGNTFQLVSQEEESEHQTSNRMGSQSHENGHQASRTNRSSQEVNNLRKGKIFEVIDLGSDSDSNGENDEYVSNVDEQSEDERAVVEHGSLSQDSYSNNSQDSDAAIIAQMTAWRNKQKKTRLTTKKTAKTASKGEFALIQNDCDSDDDDNDDGDGGGGVKARVTAVGYDDDSDSSDWGMFS